MAPTRVDDGHPRAARSLRAARAAAPAAQPRGDPPHARAAARALPEIACFDTAFHRSVPEVAQLFALPPRFAEAGVRRYGFHGLSYEYVASVLPSLDARAAAGRTVVFHLGNGASMCAMRGGQQRRHDHGLHGGRGPADGHAQRLARSGRAAVHVRRARPRRARRRAAALPRVRPARDVGPLERHARAARERRARRAAGGRGVRATARGASSARSRRPSAGSTRSSSRPASARTSRKCAGASAPTRPGSASSSTRRRMRATGHASARRGSRVSAWVVPTDEELMIARHVARLLG